MANVVLFHSVLGLRDAVLDSAEQLRAAGHTVYAPDLYDGQVFDDFDEADAFLEKLGGVQALMVRAAAAVEELPQELVYAGYSNGGGAAQFLACTRRGAQGALLFHAALPPAVFGLDTWPAGVPVQVHYGKKDPRRIEQGLAALESAVRESGAGYEFFEYPVRTHLFTDSGLPGEYDEASAEELLIRASWFLNSRI